MAKRKREWNEGGDNLFSEANLAQMDAINQRLDEAIKERTEDGKENQDRQIRANAGGDERGIDAVSSPVPGGDDAGGGGQISRSIPGRTEGAGRGGLEEIPGISSNQGGYEQRYGNRTDGISSGLDDAQKDSERENIRPNLQRVDEYGRAVLPHDDNTQMVQAPGADGLQPGELERNRDGALDGSANSRERRIQSLFDSDSQTNEGGGQYGSGDTKSGGDQSLSGIHRDIANDENGQGQDISILQATPGGEGFYYVTSTGDASDFVPGDEVPVSGAKDRFKKNIKALKLVKELNSIKLPQPLKDKKIYATKKEQEILNGFSGWGSLPQAFDPSNEEWHKEYQELKGLLSDKEFKEAQSSTQNSFYTPRIVIDTIYKSLERLGVNNDDNTKEILEPSAGTGLFLGFNKEKKYHFTTIELNELSHQICEKLYPNQLNIYSGFQDYNPQKRFDAVVGNPPYSQARVYDGNFKNLNGASIHNFFAAKSIELLKDDGIMAFVISSHFLDAKDTQIREMIAQKATFLGAVRLPNTVFKSSGTTQPVTDIVIFKKGVSKELNQDWVGTKKLNDDKFHINEYFADNPQNILGNLEIKTGRYGEELTCGENKDINLQEALSLFVDSLPKNIYKFKEQDVDKSIVYIDKQNPLYVKDKQYFDRLKPENYLVFDGKIYLKEKAYDNDDKFVIRETNLNKLEEKRVLTFIEMRDTYNQLLDLEKSDIADDDQRLTATRAKLNELYDNYHKSGDFLHNPRKNRAIRADVEAQKVISLEANYDKGITAKEAAQKGLTPRSENAQKANILTNRAIRSQADIKFDNAPDGLFASINKFGKVNIDYIAKELNKDQKDVISELMRKNMIFLNPDKLIAGETRYEFAPKYLSGNVKEKLRLASEVAKTYPEINHNVAALTSVLPKDIEASEISAPMGAPWIPLKHYNEFFEKQFGITRDNWQLSYNEKVGSWSFTGSGYRMSRYNISKFSYGHINPRQSLSVFQVAEAALMRKSIRITKDSETETYVNSKGEAVPKKVTDVEASQAANQKVELIKNLFDDWIMDDPKRRTELANIYNEKFNCYVKKSYDGERLNIKGLNQAYTLRKHQLDAVARAVNERICLFDHEVGAGKTLSSICSVMEQKRIGLIDKPLIAVPNHLISQWESEFMNAYPGANILVAEEKSTSPDNRDEFFAKIANGGYDAILITHSQLERLPVPLEITQQVLEEQINDLKESIELKERDENAPRVSIKRLEQRVDSLEAKLNELLNVKEKTKLLDFSDLGIDCLVIDESHMYKNLPFSTSLDKVKGLGSPAGSAKAINLFEKTTYLHENDKKIIFLTGTPISNSLTELYAIQKYLSPDQLKAQGIYSFDAWAATFAKIDTTFELDASAQKYKAVTRFSEFENLPEIASAYLNFADIVTNDDIKQYHEHYVPEVEVVKCVSKRSDEVAKFIGIQDDRGEFNEGSIIYRMEHMPDDPSEDNYLKCTGDAKKAGLDFRLINPNAQDEQDSKINNCVENILKEYREWDIDKGTQLVFLDIGTPRTGQTSQSISLDENATAQQDMNANEFVNINQSLEMEDESETADITMPNDTFFLYGDLYKKLVAKGIPREEIAFIHDTNGSNTKKIELFGKVNRGEVRILIGSTAKMGAGTNVQQRVTAIHHLDVPWRPSDFVQRNGRVIRQGNFLFMRDPKNFKIKEFRYITEQTYDAVSWQIIENKTKSIVNFRKGVIGGDRSLSGFDEDIASVAEMKAIATGNPLMLTQIQIKTALDKEEMLYKEFKKERHRSEDILASNAKKIEHIGKENEKLARAIREAAKFESSDFKCNAYVDNGNFTDIIPVTIPKDDASEAVKTMQEKLEKTFKDNLDKLFAKDGQEVNFVDFKGFKISGYYERTLNAVVFELENLATGDTLAPSNLTYNQQSRTSLIRDEIKFSGFFRRLNNFINSMEETIGKNEKRISELKTQNNDLRQIISESQEYGRMNILELLREDDRKINAELDKIAANKNYKSSFVARSLELLKEHSEKAVQKQKAGDIEKNESFER